MESYAAAFHRRSDCLFLYQKRLVDWLLDEEFTPSEAVATVANLPQYVAKKLTGFARIMAYLYVAVRFNVCLQSEGRTKVVLPSFAGEHRRSSVLAQSQRLFLRSSHLGCELRVSDSLVVAH